MATFFGFTAPGMMIGAALGFVIALLTPANSQVQGLSVYDRYGLFMVLGIGFGGLTGAVVGGATAVAEAIRDKARSE